MTKKVYDRSKLCDQYDVCNYCNRLNSNSYFDPPECDQKCEDAINRLIEELEENEDMDDITTLNLTVDLDTLKNEIVNSIKKELRDDIHRDLKADILKMTYEEIAKPQLDNIKTILQQEVANLLKDELNKYYTEKKITIGGGWQEETQIYTIQEYVQRVLKEAIETGTFKVSKEGRKSDCDTYQIDKYIINNCISSEIKKYMDIKLKQIQKEVDNQVKSVFETKVQDMMSEVALGVLKSNSTYNEIKTKLLNR